jgi:hypothetical protein
MMTSSVAAPTCTQPVRFRIKRFTGTRVNRQVKPNISPVSAIMDPTPLPRARPGFPIQAAITETTASGMVVPKETMVAPMTIHPIGALRQQQNTNRDYPQQTDRGQSLH